jgi:peptidoglycan hydrolase CwlO-like protein
MFVQVKRLIEKEKEDIKAMAISQISTLHTQVIEQVRRDQETLVQEKIQEKLRLEQVIEENQKKIAQQQQQLAEQLVQLEQARKQDEERKRREEEEARRREDEKRYLDLKRQLEEEEQKKTILNKNNARPKLSFSLFSNN